MPDFTGLRQGNPRGCHAPAPPAAWLLLSRREGRHPSNPLRGCRNGVFTTLTAVSDFIKRIGDEAHLLENETPQGLHLIMGECIAELKKISERL